MKSAIFWLSLVFFALSISALVASAEDAPADDTVIVLDPLQTPEELALPETASDSAVEHAQFGLSTANQARDQAPDLGREFGQQVSERAGSLDAGEGIRDQHVDARADNASARRH